MKKLGCGTAYSDVGTPDWGYPAKWKEINLIYENKCFDINNLHSTNDIEH